MVHSIRDANLRHVSAAKAVEVVDIRGERSTGSTERLARLVLENSQNFGLDTSDFQGVAW